MDPFTKASIPYTSYMRVCCAAVQPIQFLVHCRILADCYFFGRDPWRHLLLHPLLLCGQRRPQQYHRPVVGGEDDLGGSHRGGDTGDPARVSLPDQALPASHAALLRPRLPLRYHPTPHLQCLQNQGSCTGLALDQLPPPPPPTPPPPNTHTHTHLAALICLSTPPDCPAPLMSANTQTQ